MEYHNIVFPDFQAQLRTRRLECDKKQIFDPIRKLWVSLTPEEWVRQSMLQYLTQVKSYPAALMACESTIKYNGLSKRCDAIVYDKNASPILIMEFKAQNVVINQEVFDQISVYNQSLNVPFLFVSNGRTHVFCKVDPLSKKLLFSNGIPNYKELLSIL